jgi:hypothetical protein
MLIGLMAATLACIGYGTASVLQAYGARSSETVAAGHGQQTEVTATGAPTLRSTIRAALTPTFIAGMVLDVVGWNEGRCRWASSRRLFQRSRDNHNAFQVFL